MAKVTLLAHTPNPEHTVASAAKLCYSPSTIDGIREGLTDEKAASFVEMLAEIGHESPIEHASFTFGIEGVSRSLLAQITRHRIASYSVQSQRYVAEKNFEYVSMLRDRFIDKVLESIPYIKLNGPRENRLPANADFSFEYIEGESILFSLDLAGIAVSSGSACSSGSLEPSHVLLALGVDEALAHGSIRFSFGKHNTIEEIDYAVQVLKEAVDRLRMMSPLFNAKGEIKNV